MERNLCPAKVNVAMELSVCINVFTGNHTVGIVSASEDYDVLKASYKDLFPRREIEVDGHKVPLDFYFSGDYKVRENL